MNRRSQVISVLVRNGATLFATAKKKKKRVKKNTQVKHKHTVMNGTCENDAYKLSGVGEWIAFSLPTTKIRVRFPGSTTMATLMTDVGRCRFSDVWQPSYLNFYSAKIRVAKTIQFPTSDIHEGPCCRLQQGV